SLYSIFYSLIFYILHLFNFHCFFLFLSFSYFFFFFFNDTATTEIYTLSLHDALPIYIDHAAFLGTINPDTNKIPKHLFQGYLNIYNNYFKAPWMPDRTEANPNELNQDDARYGFRCCHLKNIWTAPLPPETELSRQ